MFLFNIFRLKMCSKLQIKRKSLIGSRTLAWKATNCILILWCLLELNTRIVNATASSTETLATTSANEAIKSNVSSQVSSFANQQERLIVHKRAAAASERDYNFGLGKRENELNSDLFATINNNNNNNWNDYEPWFELSPESKTTSVRSQLLEELSRLIADQHKRSDLANRYEFGLGKCLLTSN